jgi:RNA polymerase sigma-70 factor (ECF subfamily)
MCDDKILVEKTLTGDKKAFEMIVQRYQQPLLNYIGRTLGDYHMAREFTQDVFIKSYSSLSSYQPRFKFSTWLFKIASNYIIDYWRKKKIDTFSIDQQDKRYDSAPPMQLAADDMPVCRRFELAELRRRVEEALQDVPPALRELFVWRHINEFSYEEMAEIKGIPVGTIKNRVYQAKEMVRKKLGDLE